MDLKISHAFVAVHDQEEALGFYRDLLGLEVRADMPFEEMRWLALGSPAQPDLHLVLMEVGVGRPPEDQEALRSLLAKGSLDGVIFTTGDCDALFDKLKAAGVEVVQEPVEQPYGVRDCAFRDPSGNQLRFSGPPKG
jgi:catechol 2,3-dioxygenase-like lactoylglutathione lyase family enzyme